MDQQLFAIDQVCAILSYSKRKVYRMIKAGILETRGEHRGLRVTKRSIDAFVSEGKEWHAKSNQAGAITDRAAIGRMVKGTTTAIEGKPLQIRIPNGQKLNLKI